jgi:beta-lactamase superfamily II metal-dependent hydrolase
VVSNPDADHIGGFLDVFDAFEVETVYASGDPKGTLTYDTFLRAAREEGSRFEVVRAGRLLEWGGVRTDAWVPKHPAARAAIPRQGGRRAGGRAGAGLAIVRPCPACGTACKRGIGGQVRPL